MKTKMNILRFFAIALTLAVTAPASFSQESPCGNKGRYGQDSLACLTNLSLFREPAKQRNYKDAYKPWLWVYSNCPCASQFIYVDGIKIMEYRHQKEMNPEKRLQLADSLLAIYDARIKYFPINPANRRSQVGSILTRKAIDCFSYKPEAPEEAYDAIKKAIELDGADVTADGLELYIRAAIKMVNDGKAEKTLVVDTYDQLTDLMDNAIRQSAGDSVATSRYLISKNNVEILFEPFATCEDLVSIYQPKFDLNPNDAELLKKITKILDKKRCTDKELFFAATENLHKLEPSANSAYMMALKNIKEEKWGQAAEYLKQSIDLFSQEETDKKAKAYLQLASIYLTQKNYPAAKSAALKVLEFSPNDGNAYIVIGDAYASSASGCGDNELTKRVGYWAAVDKYIQARRMDQSVAETADRRISTYVSHFPSMETIFFYGLKEGDSYRVECWINETTTIRPAR